MAKRPRPIAANPPVAPPAAAAAPAMTEVAASIADPTDPSPQESREGPPVAPTQDAPWLRWIPLAGAVLLAVGLAILPAARFASVASGAWVALAATATALGVAALGPKRFAEPAAIGAAILAVVAARLAMAAAPAEWS